MISISKKPITYAVDADSTITLKPLYSAVEFARAVGSDALQIDQADIGSMTGTMDKLFGFVADQALDVTGIVIDGDPVEWSSLGADLRSVVIGHVYMENADFRSFVGAYIVGQKKTSMTGSS